MKTWWPTNARPYEVGSEFWLLPHWCPLKLLITWIAAHKLIQRKLVFFNKLPILPIPRFRGWDGGNRLQRHVTLSSFPSLCNKFPAHRRYLLVSGENWTGNIRGLVLIPYLTLKRLKGGLFRIRDDCTPLKSYFIFSMIFNSYMHLLEQGSEQKVIHDRSDQVYVVCIWI